MQARVWTVPNQITILRLGFLPLFIVSISYEHYRCSSLGAYLDPIADKLLLSSSFVILAFKHEIALWLMIFVLSRDVIILIVAVVILLIFGYRPFPPSALGKATTFFQIVMIFSVVFGAAYPNVHLGVINPILIYTVAALTVVSAVHYSFSIARRLSGSE
jgi:cardiolipin synthase